MAKKRKMSKREKSAQELAQLGRYGDSMLVHMNPAEVKAMAASGAGMTINPDTGLPEAFLQFLAPLFAAAAPAAATALPAAAAAIPAAAGTAAAALPAAAAATLPAAATAALPAAASALPAAAGAALPGAAAALPGAATLPAAAEAVLPALAGAAPETLAAAAPAAGTEALIGGAAADALGGAAPVTDLVRAQATEALRTGLQAAPDLGLPATGEPITDAFSLFGPQAPSPAGSAVQGVPGAASGPLPPAPDIGESLGMFDMSRGGTGLYPPRVLPGAPVQVGAPPVPPEQLLGSMLRGDQVPASVAAPTSTGASGLAPPMPATAGGPPVVPSPETAQSLLPPIDAPIGDVALADASLADPTFADPLVPLDEPIDIAEQVVTPYTEAAALPEAAQAAETVAEGAPAGEGGLFTRDNLINFGIPVAAGLATLLPADEIDDPEEDEAELQDLSGVDYSVNFPGADYIPGTDPEFSYFPRNRRFADGGLIQPGMPQQQMPQQQMPQQPMPMQDPNMTSHMDAGVNYRPPTIPTMNPGMSEMAMPMQSGPLQIGVPTPPQPPSVPGFGGVPMYQDGGVVQPPMPQGPPVPGQGPAPEQVIQEAAMALQGQHPNPEMAIQMFVSLFGEEALMNLQAQVAGENPRMIDGPGGPKDDMVPARINDTQEARLSDGEFVMTADAVRNAGNGDPGAGAQQLRQLNDMLSGRPSGQLDVDRVR